MPDHLAPSLEAVLRRLQGTQLPYKARLTARIQHLTAAFADDYDGRTLSARSIAGLIDFLKAAPLPGYPDLTLTPTGHCYAEWHGSQGRKVAIEFLDSGEARHLHHKQQRPSGSNQEERLA